MTARAAALLLALTATSLAPRSGDVSERFPHRRHATMFPTCESCHSGIASGDSARMFPPPAICASCHDGTIAKTVQWAGPAVRPTNLEFSHTGHVTAVRRTGDALTCSRCHALADSGAVWMAVRGAQPAACLDCHDHRASEHLGDDNPCRTCHVPLVAARTLPVAAIARFHRPPSHELANFLSAHAPRTTADEMRCATCHARESCERCHVNAEALASVRALGPDPRVASIEASHRPLYPIPADHQPASWASDHGQAAKQNTQSCANCHAQSSCTACHTGPGAAQTISALPRPARGKAQGVIVRNVSAAGSHRNRAGGGPDAPPASPSRAPSGGGAAQLEPASIVTQDTGRLLDRHGTAGLSRDSGQRLAVDSGQVHIVRVHWPGFITSHSTAASSRQMTCSNCHAQRFCTECHNGEGRHDFHPVNFIARHAAEAYNRQLNCVQCHSPEAFCRTCHLNIGLSQRAAHNAAFHTAEPLWLLQHGQAARQSLETCTNCHQERDCLRCHSTIGQGVNPHGPNFNARKMQAANPQMCLECHLTNPLLNPGR